MNSLMNTDNSQDESEDKSEFAANLNSLRQIEFFSSMSIEVLKLFALLFKRQTYKADEFIFRQGDDDGCSYYILSGKAGLFYKNQEKEHFIREYKKETYLSIMSLMGPVVKQFSLKAQEEVSCLVMTREAFSKVLGQFPEISVKIMRTIGQQVALAERRTIFEFESKQGGDIKNLLGISLL